MQPAPLHYASRLRELGLVPPSETIDYIDHGDWKQHGQFFVARIEVGVINVQGSGKKAYWLKCPHDFYSNLNDVVLGRVELAKRLRASGCNVPRTEWLEPATMIQEEVVGRLVPSDLHPPEWAEEPIRREKALYTSVGLKYMDGSGGNFIVDDQGRAWCIDLDFNEIPNEERAAHTA